MAQIRPLYRWSGSTSSSPTVVDSDSCKLTMMAAQLKVTHLRSDGNHQPESNRATAHHLQYRKTRRLGLSFMFFRLSGADRSRADGTAQPPASCDISNPQYSATQKSTPGSVS